MISGIVYFDEIIEGVKDATGIENMNPFYEKIRRFVLRSEYDIAPSGLIVRKNRDYTIGDGYYDGNSIILPYDLMGEYSYEKLNTAYFRGNRLELIEQPGPETTNLVYMGLLLDSYGNPITTRNHYEAIIAFCTWKLYAPKVIGEISRGFGNFFCLKRILFL